ncbi:hypothetical protein [Mucilaginibacter sp. L3T2-6]|uniref:hypothetical protein n=1 Tax=Mucilaginibacter sp. L3T2-6 TaxID=3062491 RepID=UPI002675A101|nr:hypothetical protein [Mucilaginibacter sp. L3T2-6]MDO3641832.1 hypothetical protein [Mucilaginibacter sp. L3T2-6]MDV6214490.1 hypothetical protein [Mucilaginibacter sp. L3T2-6]
MKQNVIPKTKSAIKVVIYAKPVRFFLAGICLLGFIVSDKLKKTYGDSFVNNFWKQAELRPAAATTHRMRLIILYWRPVQQPIRI